MDLYGIVLLATLLARDTSHPSCIQHPEYGFGRRFRLAPEDRPTPQDFTRFDIEDIDGDKVPDFLLAARQTCSGSHNCDAEVYASGHGCLRRLGRVAGAAFYVLRPVHKGLHDIRAVLLSGDSDRELVVYRFDGSKYVERPGAGDGRP